MSLGTVQNMIIGSILCMVLVLGGVSVLTSFYSADTSLDTRNDISNFNSTMNQAVAVSNATSAIQNSISKVSSSNANIGDYFNLLVSSVYDGLKAIFGSLGFIGVMLGSGTGSISALFGASVLSPMTILIGLVVVIIIGFAIWAAVMRVNV